MKHRVAHVEPAEDLPGRSTWLRSSQGLSFARQARTGCEWWTYAGLKANAALVRRHGLPATLDSLTIRARCSPIELNRASDAPPTDSVPEIV